MGKLVIVPTPKGETDMTGTSDTSTESQHPDSDPVDRMEELFERQGFARTSVDDLREVADVSLRTLYRRYGSREQMIVTVLRNRAEKYLAHLAGSNNSRELFTRTTEWTAGTAFLGCLFLRARADHPGHAGIEQAIMDYYTALHSRLGVIARADGIDGCVDELFLLHEGLLAAAAAVGPQAALESTLQVVDRLVAGNDPADAACG